MASEALRNRILGAGQRITPQRDLIAGVLEGADRPLSAQEICDAVEQVAGGVGRATVFRALQSLHEADIVEHVTLPGNQAGYLLCATSGHHHHLVCRSCGQVQDVEEGEVGPFLGALEGRYGYHVDHASFTVYGTCPACRPGD